MNELVFFQTPSICVRSCATRAAVGHAPWPRLSDADVAPRLRYAETLTDSLSLAMALLSIEELKQTFLFSRRSRVQRSKKRVRFKFRLNETSCPLCLVFHFRLFSFPEELVFTCEKRCNKKRSCGRHKCGELCCVVSVQQPLCCNLYTV